LDFATSCCPNPHCPELVAPPHTKYCSECGGKLSPISFDAWLKKIVEPAFEQNPLDVLLPASRISAPLAQMGLPKDEGLIHLDQFLADNAGIGRSQFNQWMQNATAILKDRETDLESRKYQARKEAANFKISPFVASLVVDKFTSETIEETSSPETPTLTTAIPSSVSDKHGELRQAELEGVTSPVGEKSSLVQANSEQSAQNGNKRMNELGSSINNDVGATPGDSVERPNINIEKDASTAPAKPAPAPSAVGSKRKDYGAVVAIVIIALVVTVFIFFSPKSNPTSTHPPNANETKGSPDSHQSLPSGMVRVEGGNLQLMSADDDVQKREAEVHVDPFLIDTKEVTCRDYEEFLEKSNYQMPPGWKATYCLAGSEDLPVTGVDWSDANAYAESLGKRLPTVEEWEFAARGEKQQRYPWGNDWISDAANAGPSSRKHLAKACQSKAGMTASGICDLIGNVWEWTATLHDRDAATGRSEAAEMRIIKGGAYNTPKEKATVNYQGYWFARRSDANKARAAPPTKLGFRCAQSINK